MHRRASPSSPGRCACAVLALASAVGASTNDTAVPLHATGDTYADNRYVHQWIAREAYAFFTNCIDGADLGPHLGTLPGSFDDRDDNLLEGVCDEDLAGENPASPLSAYYWFPYLEHFCAGADGAELDDGLAASPAAVSRATWYWNNYVLPRYAASPASCFYYLGHVAHLLADMTIPAHVHNDEHVAGEPYEDGVATDGWFKLWFLGCTRSGLAAAWTWPLSVDYPDLRTLLHRTANYTEDYDSADAPGDVAAGAAAYDPGDYPADWHRPQDVSRSDGMSLAELTTTADDLMPYAIRRVAELYRLFYRQADATPPAVSLLYPDASDPAQPTRRDTLQPFLLTATAGDAQSGIVRAGFRFAWCREEPGGGWSDWQDVQPVPTVSAVTFTPAAGNGLYAFRVRAENGGGALAEGGARYLRVAVPPDPPRLSLAAADADRLVLAWGSRAGELYTVQQCGSLGGSTGWTVLAADLAATPPLNTHTDGVAGVRQRFYRVQAFVPTGD